MLSAGILYILLVLENYIQRRLFSEGKPLTERECLNRGGAIIVLAEPGAGKTELLESFSTQLGTTRQRAGIFRHIGTVDNARPLVIDALDEVARQDQSAVHGIIVKAVEAGAPKLVFASRSSEWDDQQTRYVEECAGSKPTVVYLKPFDDDEQRQLFKNKFPDEDFDKFRAEVDRIGLMPLLGNPMFLLLFVEGYIQAGRNFESKRQIFSDAVERLASGDGKSNGATPRAPDALVQAAASELFAKLLLSGATGFTTVELIGDQDFPYLYGLSDRNKSVLQDALNSRLFKPTTDANCHEPVHRIVAEYCAARYLANRLSDPSDTLSLQRCLAIIAPNGVVRDELRGLIGWLAAVGDVTLQKAVIELDPYAVIANGDPAQLLTDCKALLLGSLFDLSQTDPYFRRADVWRRFNAAGFFTLDLARDLQKLLSNPEDGSHLLDLVLELVEGEPVCAALTSEFRSLMLDPARSLITRLRAQRCIVTITNYTPAEDASNLIRLGDFESLNVAARFTVDNTTKALGKEQLLDLLTRLGNPGAMNNGEPRRYQSRYFITELLRCLDHETTVWLLDNLNTDLPCTCGANNPHLCNCRHEISKIAGRLLDQYFHLTDPGQHSPEKIWHWMRNLKFERTIRDKDAQSIQALRDNNELRHAIHLLAFEGQTDSDQIWNTTCDLRWRDCHAGLRPSVEDEQALAQHGFETDNVALWGNFAYGHNSHSETKGPDPYRTKLREQARAKPDFMRVWAARSRAWREADRKYRYSSSRRVKRIERRRQEAEAATLRHLNENRAMIEQGNHWGWTKEFARYFLHFPEKLEEVAGNRFTAERALSNCFSMAAPHLPSLGDLAEGKGRHIAEVLHAGCLVHFRTRGSLNCIDAAVLRVVKTDLANQKAYRDGEAELFEAEIDSRILRSDEEVEAFARAYIEPTISASEGTYSSLWWLDNKERFQPLRAKLAPEWIETYRNASYHTTDKLFDICARCCDRSWLLDLIERRCDELINANKAEQAWQKGFWFIRHFFFAREDRDGIWGSVLSDLDGIFALENIAGRLGRTEASAWPTLNAEKVFRILDAYVEVWPRVFLPSSWGSDSPKEERAYRFLTDIVWHIEKDQPETAIPIIDRMLTDLRYSNFHTDLRSIKAMLLREQGLRSFVLPKPADVVALMDKGAAASVEDLRALILEELEHCQQWLNGAETDPIDMFWLDDKHVDENTARNRIVERLQARLTALDTSVAIEHHMADSKRCDFTVAKVIDGRRRLLVCEVKGQWHKELYSAAGEQLDKRYAIHPDAAQQGIFLALWFGPEEKVAGKAKHAIQSAEELRTSILEELPDSLRGFIDVFVLNLSRG